MTVETVERTLANCPSVIFIAYGVNEGAEERGYSDWLRRVDNPFFNAIPGVRHYANWRVQSVFKGAPMDWDYFDFQGLTAEEALEPVWFNPDLDGFRREWIRLWGYGRPQPLPVHAHSYVMRPVSRSGAAETGLARIIGGKGEPVVEGDLVYRVEGVLSKHFAAGGAPKDKPWLSPASEDNPLGLDWITVRYGKTEEELRTMVAPDSAEIDMIAGLIASPIDH